MKRINTLLAVAAVAALLLAGCSINANKGEEDKKGDKVDIESPLGSIHVKTNEQASAHDTGLPVYPGAREVPPEKDDNTSRANVSLGFGGFGLKVVAAKYESDDSVDKLKDFYRKALSKYGKVVECQGDLDLDPEHGKSPKCNSSSSEPGRFEMGVSEGNAQRLVSIRPKGKTNRFALVYVETHGKERETM